MNLLRDNNFTNDDPNIIDDDSQRTACHRVFPAYPKGQGLEKQGWPTGQRGSKR